MFQNQIHVYTKSVCLDIRNGKPYYLESILKNKGAAYYGDDHYTSITYDELKEYAKKCGCYDIYKDLDENNWEKLISDEKLESVRSKRIEIPLGECADTDTFDVDEFYFSLKSNCSSYLTYLRKCDTGYRLFHASNADYRFCARFFRDFTRTEEEIERLLEGKAYPEYFAYDRLLSDKELQYIAYLFNNYKSLRKDYGSLGREYQVTKTIKNREFACRNQGGYYTIEGILEKIAKHGTNYSMG